MLAYIIRRILYAIPTLLGVNILLFILFFFINKPDVMARKILGEKRATPEMIESWKREHGYHLPRFINTSELFPAMFTQTIFGQKMLPLFLFRFGKSDREDAFLIGNELRRRIPYSLSLTVPIFVGGLIIYLAAAMIIAFYRASYIDTAGLVICVVMMSISTMFYILGGQYLVAIKLKLAPISGFDRSLLGAVKFLALPIFIGIISDIGAEIRYYRTIFLEEINKDYVRTARAKGLGEGSVLFKHALKNAMIPILTNTVVHIPFLITGALLFENFFGIPGLGNFTIEAVNGQDFASVRSMVFLGSVLYVVSLICVDISYTLVDPRVRLK